MTWEKYSEYFWNFLLLHTPEYSRIAYRTVEDFLTLSKDHQKEWYSLDYSIYNFVLYYNDRFQSTTKVAPCKVVINVSDWNFWKIKNIIKRKIKTKKVYVVYPDDCNVRISNWIKIIDK